MTNIDTIGSDTIGDSVGEAFERSQSRALRGLHSLLDDAGPHGVVSAEAVRSAIGSRQQARRSGPVRVYVACPLTEVAIACLIASNLSTARYEVTSTWHGVVKDGRESADPDMRRLILRQNLQDLARADMVVAWTASGKPKGTYGEIGRACAAGKPVVWIQGTWGDGASIDDADPMVTIVWSIKAEDVMRVVGEVSRTVRG